MRAFLFVRQVVSNFIDQIVDILETDNFFPELVIVFQIVRFAGQHETATAGHFEVPPLDLLEIIDRVYRFHRALRGRERQQSGSQLLDLASERHVVQSSSNPLQMRIQLRHVSVRRNGSVR